MNETTFCARIFWSDWVILKFYRHCCTKMSEALGKRSNGQLTWRAPQVPSDAARTREQLQCVWHKNQTATSSSPLYLNDLTKQMKALMVTTKNLTTVMPQFVLTYWNNFRNCKFLPNATKDFKLAGAGTSLNERFIVAVFRTTTESMEAPNVSNVSEMGTVKIMLAGIEMTAVLDASMTENSISFKTLYELKPFPNFQPFENNLVWTESRPRNIVAESCPKVLVGYVNFLVSHDIGYSASLGSKFLKGNNLMGAAHLNSERVEDYCEGSEAMKHVDHSQRMEKVELLTIVLLCGTVGKYGTMSPLEEKISSDPAKASRASILRVVDVS